MSSLSLIAVLFHLLAACFVAKNPLAGKEAVFASNTTNPTVVTELDLYPLTVNTTYGPIRGQFDSQSRVFRGIPYAQPPIGELRWKPPRAPAAWSTVYDATQILPGCPQFCDVSKFVCPSNSTQMSESCLYMNIWTPQYSTSSSVNVDKRSNINKRSKQRSANNSTKSGHDDNNQDINNISS